VSDPGSATTHRKSADGSATTHRESADRAGRSFDLETAHLRLRPLRATDLDEMHRLWTDPGVRRYLWDDEIISRERVADVIAQSTRMFAADGLGLWAAFPRDPASPAEAPAAGGATSAGAPSAAPPLVGFCGFWAFHEPPQLQLLYGVAPSHWGRGLATEMARAMLRRGFEVHGFERIVACADAPNRASLRVMEKAGMTFERRALVDGRDTIYYVATRGAEAGRRLA
jgi:ribosomal-protein-alanine N-acetyltransferase